MKSAVVEFQIFRVGNIEVDTAAACAGRDTTVLHRNPRHRRIQLNIRSHPTAADNHNQEILQEISLPEKFYNFLRDKIQHQR